MDGILPLDSKMAAIRDLMQPENITELRGFLGWDGKSDGKKFNPKLAEVSAPLQDALSSSNNWLWTETHSVAFNKFKKVLQDPLTLKLYDVSRPTKI